eukprot:TRINITY_DN2536_c0_g1_i1.p1 TRINITY_DN2536_c0_g1~~TRINITY_DN2536_c0_g1_i1.p1  ORF type:complete len:381 (+),score=135.65 TRINITY_DN2536_c0_g1_i1:33-1145(+)
MERVEVVLSHLSPNNLNVNNNNNNAIMTENCSSNKAPKRIVVTGAAGQIAYSLLFQIATGRMLGPDQPIILHLLDIPPAENALNGVVMELEDCAFELVHDIVATVDPKIAFKDADLAIFVGAFPRRKGMLRKDLLEKNASIFYTQGKILNQYAKRSVKVLVVGNPANTNCLILMNSAPDIPKRNFSALTRLDYNRAKAQVAEKCNVPVSKVHNVIIWGNHSSTQYPDVNHGFISDFPSDGLNNSIKTVVNDIDWIQSTFIPKVQKRGAAIIAARKLSSAASAANAIVCHCRDWLLGTAPGEFVSMGIYSDGSLYGIPEGIIYSFPVRCQAGSYSVVKDLPIDDFSREKMDATAQELVDEKNTAFNFLSNN